MTQVTIPHVSIEGINYINCSFTQPDDQEYCPLEHTEYESLCINPVHNVQLRESGPCEHSAECFVVRAQLNAQRLDR
jgi:hypothetical protein